MINYVIGDATAPIGEGPKVIAHICNDAGLWGSGFVLAVSKRWPEPEAEYRALTKYTLGSIKVVDVAEDLAVCNMIGQHNVRSEGYLKPIRYSSVRLALIKLNRYLLASNSTLHIPRIGCDRAGGSWKVMESILKDCIEVDITVYDLK